MLRIDLKSKPGEKKLIEVNSLKSLNSNYRRKQLDEIHNTNRKFRKDSSRLGLFILLISGKSQTGLGSMSGIILVGTREGSANEGLLMLKKKDLCKSFREVWIILLRSFCVWA